MNLTKRVKGCCKDCIYSDFEGALGNNQKLVCQIMDGAPHGRYPSYTLKECPCFEQASEFVKKRNARRLKAKDKR